MTNRYETDKIYAAMVDTYSYNYDTELVENLLIDLNTNGQVGAKDEWTDNEGLDQFWCMFVLLFGDYGTSPRFGWLYGTEKSRSFMKEFYDDLKELE